MRSFQKKVKPGYPNAIAKLTGHGAEQIAADFDMLMDLTGRQEELLENGSNHEEATRVVTATLAVLRRDAIGFDRRIQRPFDRLDFRKLRLFTYVCSY